MAYYKKVFVGSLALLGLGLGALVTTATDKEPLGSSSAAQNTAPQLEWKPSPHGFMDLSDLFEYCFDDNVVTFEERLKQQIKILPKAVQEVLDVKAREHIQRLYYTLPKRVSGKAYNFAAEERRLIEAKEYLRLKKDLNIMKQP
ncbi:MAG: hypothetical protein RLZ12_975 [Bacillota bacterium]